MTTLALIWGLATIRAMLGPLTIAALLALIIIPLLAPLGVLLCYLRNRLYGLDPWLSEPPPPPSGADPAPTR